MGSLWQDLRYAFRMLWKAPGFTVVAVLSLALGLGANISIFSVVNAVLLRPLPVERADELVLLHTNRPSGINSSFSYPLYTDYRDRNEVFSGLIAFGTLPFTLSSESETERVSGVIASGNYFDTLGVKPVVGRTFTMEEDRAPSAHPVAVISYSLWQRRFNSDPNVVGKAVKVNAHNFTIIGVAPRGFTGAIRGYNAEVWLPMMMNREAQPGSKALTERGEKWLLMMGRLKPGTTPASAQASLGNLTAQLVREDPDFTEEQIITTPGNQGFTALLEDLTMPLKVLMVVVGLVLLIACANVANLQLARATMRRKEIAVRLAVGASRARLVRQFLTESVLLSVVGGTIGLVLALWTTDFFRAFRSPVTYTDVALDIDLDTNVFLFALALSILTGLIFGLAPALNASRADLVPALKDEAVGIQLGRRRFTLRKLLVVVQVALSLVVLVGTGLFVRSLQKLQAIDPGFEADNVLLMSFEPELNGYDEARGRAFYRDLIERVQNQGGVRAASLARVVRLGFGGSRRSIEIEGYEQQKGESMEIDFNVVSPGYFQTMNIPILRGREFNSGDGEGAPLVAVINETMARRYFPNRDAVGQRFLLPSRETKKPVEIVGVAREGKYRNLRETARPSFYLSFLQNYSPAMTLHVRTTSDPRALVATIEREVHALDKDLPVFNVKTYKEQFSSALYRERLATTLLSVFGLLALLLATIGIYGVISYSVTQRTHEIGVRMALGAQSSDVLRMFIRQGMVLALIGVVIGLGAAFALTRVVGSLLYGVTATDPLTFAFVSIGLATVALLASLIPAFRATRVDPLQALRYE